MLKYQAKRIWRRASWVERCQGWSRMPGRWRWSWTGWGTQRVTRAMSWNNSKWGCQGSGSAIHAQRHDRHTWGVHTSFWSVPYGPLRLSTHSINKERLKTNPRKVSPANQLTMLYGHVENIPGELDCSESLYMDWVRRRSNPLRHNTWAQRCCQWVTWSKLTLAQNKSTKSFLTVTNMEIHVNINKYERKNIPCQNEP